MRMLPIFILLVSSYLALGNLVPNQKTWTYMMRSVQMSTSDESIAGGTTRLDRISRGEFGLTGTLYFNTDVPRDLEAEVNIYRSTDGGGTYKLEPFSVPRRKVYDALNTFYKDIIMKSAANCSDLPQFKGTLDIIHAREFHYEKCRVSTDGFPNYLSDGLYKIEVKTFGIVHIIWEVVVEVVQKTF
ncbi:uncharacterized protein LOC108051131 [Drosophila rhopaloa]|uniref:Uncharacterized protein LOC108051131 n=1 Tax=Drosophila rhopaloa TaxID=1041015 RepID=A0A6P4FTV8_DRORH|nr:uncharacterized protein LOC108051131 [Drosophila rhopaloa]